MFKPRRFFLVIVIIVIASSLMTPALGTSSATAQVGPAVKTFNISAIDVDITINRFSDHDPEGKMYVLDENIPTVRAQEAIRLPDRVSIALRCRPPSERENSLMKLIISHQYRLFG